MSADAMDIDSPPPSQLSTDKKRKNKIKDHSSSKKRKHTTSDGISTNISEAPKKSKKDKSHESKHNVVVAEPASNSDPNSPFRLVNATMYLPLSPISISPTHASASLAAEHLAPLLLTYYPPFKGIVMAYSNASISSTPPAPEQLHNSGDNPKPLTLALTANEYGVLYLYLTATFLVFSPQKGQILEGWVNVQSEGFLGAVAYNLFSVGLERKRLPANWKWVPPGADDEGESGSETTRSHTNGLASAPTSGDEDESNRSEFNSAKEHFTPLPKPVTRNPIELDETLNVEQEIEESNDTGFFQSVSGHRVRGTVRFRVRDIDVIPGGTQTEGLSASKARCLPPRRRLSSRRRRIRDLHCQTDEMRQRRRLVALRLTAWKPVQLRRKAPVRRARKRRRRKEKRKVRIRTSPKANLNENNYCSI
ncbi:hypothetical protein BGW36DRAFT_410817 [Talaromyces proteolyticus]|uniref:DNA-directed RNA polymerase subunit n=1 Tax=Talaromyces proteolyticus TaxID=1131652 RepID=A0AAD4PXB0_9EURO|nr:uncharacterized protein BGW36DRAFT_410817 [Talaromyces proteolyticus]KAH8692399.1 hypothetical protein BGW36DRAFT_410817 [Talaromyces proteolyticus]